MDRVWLLAMAVLCGLLACGWIIRAIHRLPWQKSLFWPGARCPLCHRELRWLDRLPVISYWMRNGRYVTCGDQRCRRDPWIEILTILTFAGVAWADLEGLPRLTGVALLVRVLYHQILCAFLIVASLIDADYTIIPDQITLPGMAIGLVGGTLLPMIRLSPSVAIAPWEGFFTGICGLIVGGGMIWIIRILGSLLFRREAMGFGDVTLMAMIGSYLGWEPMPPILFLGAFLALIPSLGRCVLYIVQGIQGWLFGKKRRSSLGEIPFGPWLSLAAILLLLCWKWIWPRWLEPQYSAVNLIAEFLTGGS